MMSGSDEGTLWAACPCTFRKVGVAGLLDRRALIVSPACAPVIHRRVNREGWRDLGSPCYRGFKDVEENTPRFTPWVSPVTS